MARNYYKNINTTNICCTNDWMKYHRDLWLGGDILLIFSGMFLVFLKNVLGFVVSNSCVGNSEEFKSRGKDKSCLWFHCDARFWGHKFRGLEKLPWRRYFRFQEKKTSLGSLRFKKKKTPFKLFLGVKKAHLIFLGGKKIPFKLFFFRSKDFH